MWGTSVTSYFIVVILFLIFFVPLEGKFMACNTKQIRHLFSLTSTDVFTNHALFSDFFSKTDLIIAVRLDVLLPHLFLFLLNELHAMIHLLTEVM